MGNFKKSQLIAIVFFLIFTCCFFIFQFKKLKPSFEYFSADCSIYSRAGMLIYKNDSKYTQCAFHSNGMVIASNPFEKEFSLIDINDSVLWEADEYIHHDFKFTKDNQSILAISSEPALINNSFVRADCFSKRDLKNKLTAKWCVKDHLEELKSLDFNSLQTWDNTDKYQRFTGEKYPLEITHANSIYEIPKNTRGLSDLRFAEGNFILNIYGPSRLIIILDSQMKKIMWSKNLQKFNIDENQFLVTSHDIQITDDGNLLALFNTMLSLKENSRLLSVFENIFKINIDTLYCCFINKNTWKISKLIEFDPINNKIYWSHSGEFFGPYGSIQKLEKSYFFAHSSTGGHVFEIDSHGEILWNFYNPVMSKNLNQRPALIRNAKAMTDTSFLKARNLIE